MLIQVLITLSTLEAAGIHHHVLPSCNGPRRLSARDARRPAVGWASSFHASQSSADLKERQIPGAGSMILVLTDPKPTPS